MPTLSSSELLERRLLSKMQATCKRYQLLQDGDRILVAISGGKDSYTLLHLLRRNLGRIPFSVELVAVHLDQQQPGYDGLGLETWLRQEGYAFEILSEDTYSVVTDHLDDQKTYCSLCSRLRRGILYSAAERLGCNKIALGHHRDDALETFLMNLFYAGKLQAMPAAYTTNDQRFQVIRPLIETGEQEIEKFAHAMSFPIIPCNLCGSQEGLQRDQMTALLNQLQKTHPHVRQVMLNALRNVRPTHLLDEDLKNAWQGRNPQIRPDKEAVKTVARNPALPKQSSPGLNILAD